ncbi:MAG: DUF1330 domain-containing protein [Rhodobacteraceae bacterium]|nr:DUF1330 domain-containing protein [Paracoccaceae bacterium]
MAAIVTATITLKDPEKMQEYAALAAPTVAAHGGTFLYRARMVKPLRGEAGHHMVAGLRFPDVAAAEAWWNSPEYNALHDLRDTAADVVFVLHEDL